MSLSLILGPALVSALILALAAVLGQGEGWGAARALLLVFFCFSLYGVASGMIHAERACAMEVNSTIGNATKTKYNYIEVCRTNTPLGDNIFKWIGRLLQVLTYGAFVYVILYYLGVLPHKVLKG